MPAAPATDVRRTLEHLQVAALGSVSQEALDVEDFRDRWTDQVARKLVTSILAEKIEIGSFTSDPHRVPATWWDHWKQDKAPAWFRHRYPPHYQEITLTVNLTRWAKYPMASIPLPDARLGTPIVYDVTEAQMDWT